MICVFRKTIFVLKRTGCLDEKNAVIGIIRSISGVVNSTPLSAVELVLCFEQEMDAMSIELQDQGYFLLPGGTPVSAQHHFARTIAHRAERRLWTLNGQDTVNEDILRFVNRLSDFSF